MSGQPATASLLHDEVREYISPVTPKGMITIPQEIRRSFNIKPKGKVIFRVSANIVEIKPVSMTLEEAMGSVPALSPAKSWKEIREAVKEERVDRYIAKMNQ